MNSQITVSVIGGDRRQLYTAEYLRKLKYKTGVFGFDLLTDKISKVDFSCLSDALTSRIIVLPLPLSKNQKSLNAPFSSKEIYLKEITDLIDANKTVFYGMGEPQFIRALTAQGAACHDCFTDETLTLKNALLTSEGIVSIIIDKTPITVFGMKIAITGYGRVAYFTAKSLKLLGAKVSVFARSSLQLAKAQTAGLDICHIDSLKENAKHFDCIINTVPFPIVTKDVIKSVKESCLLIETASAPYGIDFDAAAEEKIQLIKAFSLPGKTAPETAGKIIAETLDNIIKGV